MGGWGGIVGGGGRGVVFQSLNRHFCQNNELVSPAFVVRPFTLGLTQGRAAPAASGEAG